MITKTFKAQNMLAALKEVQDELGPDAMILSMREVPSGPVWAAWLKPGVEVIATKASEKKPASSQTEQNIPVNRDKPSQEELKREIENLKKIVTGQKVTSQSLDSLIKQSEHLRSADGLVYAEDGFSEDDIIHQPVVDQSALIDNETKGSIPIGVVRETKKNEQKVKEILPENLESLRNQLIKQGIDCILIDKIIETNINSLSPAAIEDKSRLEKFIKHQLSVHLTPTSRSLAFVPGKIMALIGPSGSGKTSACAKIAAFYMMKMGKNVVWIEADTVKTSAISEARTYSETLGIPLFLAYTPQELAELIQTQTDADLILVDTASCNPRVEDKIIELGSFLSVLPTNSAYYVASATTKNQDLLETEATFKQFGIKGLIVTKTDETGTFGPLYNLGMKSRLPFYFFTTGNRVMDNLMPGNHELLVASLFKSEFSRD